MQDFCDKNYSLKETQTTPSTATDRAEYPEGMYKAVKSFWGEQVGAESEDCKIACKEHVINVDFKMPLNLIVHRSWLKQRVGTFLKFKNFISATSICLFVQKGEVGWHKIAHKYLEDSLKISPGSPGVLSFVWYCGGPSQEEAQWNGEDRSYREELTLTSWV